MRLQLGEHPVAVGPGADRLLELVSLAEDISTVAYVGETCPYLSKEVLTLR